MSEVRSGEILIFGAGNIGRSFVGQIFGRAGYTPVFADVDRDLVSALARNGRYTVVHRAPAGGEERIDVHPVDAVRADDPEQLTPVLRRVSLVATSVGAAVLPRLLSVLATEAVRRFEAGVPPFDVILAENIHDGGEIVRRAMKSAFAALPQDETSRRSPGYHGSRPVNGAPGVVECSVGKMVPLVPEELSRAEPTTVYAEEFNELLVDAEGWAGAPPAVPQLRLVSPIGAWVDRKLYIHNFGHAATAYLGYSFNPDVRFVWEALEEPSVRRDVHAAMSAAGLALHLTYPGVFSSADIEDHIEDLLHRFSSRGLGDTVYRVGRDLQRKLSAGDRIIGTLRLLQKHSLDTSTIERVYRAALRFRATDENGALFPADEVFLRDRLAVGSAARFLAEISGMDLVADAELLARLTAAY
ncbi:MAG: mannitol-1-phosphate 5-dehydrogenase [Spirochaeta sp.]|jgi:mannitol-1-phosphate 5-dehydrogenase|nr:mannitol-1-phosphate 5-dehydrogenase [Spirochaeta sp.]